MAMALHGRGNAACMRSYFTPRAVMFIQRIVGLHDWKERKNDIWVIREHLCIPDPPKTLRKSRAIYICIYRDLQKRSRVELTTYFCVLVVNFTKDNNQTSNYWWMMTRSDSPASEERPGDRNLQKFNYNKVQFQIISGGNILA